MSGRASSVDPANADQARGWNGDEGERWASNAGRYDLAVATYRQPFLDAAEVAVTDRVLDVGCGAGDTTLDVARAAAGGSVLGVDLSEPLLEVARRRAADAGITNVELVRADAQVCPFEPASFDGAVSRMGSMFFAEPVVAFGNIARSIVPDGRLTLLTWQPFAEQEWMRTFRSIMAAGRDIPPPPPGRPGPFGLSEPDRVHAILDSAGYAHITLDDVRAPMSFGEDVDEAYAFIVTMVGWMLDGLDDDARAGVLDALRASVAQHATPDGVRYGSAAWIVRARRR